MILIGTLQIISALVWAAVSGWSFGPWLRSFGFYVAPQDENRSICFYFGLIQILALIRWQVWPHSIETMSDSELAFWAGIYAAVAALGVRVLLLYWERRR